MMHPRPRGRCNARSDSPKEVVAAAANTEETRLATEATRSGTIIERVAVSKLARNREATTQQAVLIPPVRTFYSAVISAIGN